MKNHRTKLQMYFFAGLFLAVLCLAFFIFLPFLIPLSVAAAFAVLCAPLYERIKLLTGKRESLSALFTIFIVTLILLVPLIFVGRAVLQEALNFSTQIGGESSHRIGYITQFIEEHVSRYFPGFSLDFSKYAQYGANWLVQNIGNIFSGVAQVLLGLFLGFLAFYYLLKDGRKLKESLVALSPLPDAYDREILTKLREAINSVFKGSLSIAVIQGTLTGIGLAIFGVPSPALLGMAAAFSALIPGVGTSLVLIPAIVFLFLTGPFWSGMGLLVWGMLAVGLIDNLLGPKLMKHGMHIHSFLILLSVLGGLNFFGPIGFFLGPLVLSLFFALIGIYSLLIRPV